MSVLDAVFLETLVLASNTIVLVLYYILIVNIGKRMVARLYAKFLTSIGVITSSNFKEVTGLKLANIGVLGCEKLFNNLLNNSGGVVFINKAY